MTARARKVTPCQRLPAARSQSVSLRKGHPMVSYCVENWSASVVTVAVL